VNLDKIVLFFLLLLLPPLPPSAGAMMLQTAGTKSVVATIACSRSCARIYC